MEAIKVGAAKRINHSRGEVGIAVQGAFLRSRPADGEGIPRKCGMYSPEPGEGGMGKPSGGLAVVERP